MARNMVVSHKVAQALVPVVGYIINYYIIMQRSFGTEISGNLRSGVELLDIQRAGILSAVEAGEEKTEIAIRYRISRYVVYNIIN
jgi:hypothetical protein